MSNQTITDHDGGMHESSAPRKANAFDVRVVIAALIGFYGIVLVILGITADSPESRAKTGDVNANLWSGLAMTVVAVAFVMWARLRPVLVDSRSEPTDETDPHQT